MRWLSGPICLLFCVGRAALGELPTFDLSPLRSDELCGPSSIKRQPDTGNFFWIEEVCPIQNHIRLFGEEKPIFMQRVEQIRNASANRAVSVFLKFRDPLVQGSILGPIGKQIVQFTITDCSEDDLTSRFPAIGLSSLLDLRFKDCDGLRIHKADFSGLENIRAIEFKAASPAFVEEGTFTNLPTLQTLAPGNEVGRWNRERLNVYKQLKCDVKNAWLWEFLKGKPGLQTSRSIGDIFTLGNFTSTVMEVDNQMQSANESREPPKQDLEHQLTVATLSESVELFPYISVVSGTKHSARSVSSERSTLVLTSLFCTLVIRTSCITINRRIN